MPFPRPKAQWAELVETIEARLAGNEFLFEPAPELTATAEAIMQKLRSREMVQAADDALMGNTANVQLDSLEMDNGRSVGCERLALEALESLRFSEALKNVGMSDRDARIAMAMVIARMVHPSSERAALNWLETNSATLELLRLDTGKGLKLDKLYRLSDVLVKHHRTIEDALFARQRKLFGTGGAVIFYIQAGQVRTFQAEAERLSPGHAGPCHGCGRIPTPIQCTAGQCQRTRHASRRAGQPCHTG